MKNNMPNCIHCGTPVKMKHRKYCSQKCSNIYNGFQKGHTGFLTADDYKNRNKPQLSNAARRIFAANIKKANDARKGKPSPKKGKHYISQSIAKKKYWDDLKKNNPELYKKQVDAFVKAGSKTLSKLHRTYITWIEKRFAEFLDVFGYVEGENFLTQVYIKTDRNCRYADFLLPSNIIIEVDGEHFHQDLEKEKIRDDELVRAGYTVFHFTGKDIKNDPIKCCDRLIRIINDYACASAA